MSAAETGLIFAANRLKAESKRFVVTKGVVDVVVTDGFTGNVALKTAEGIARMYAGFMRSAFKSSVMSRLGYLFARSALGKVRARLEVAPDVSDADQQVMKLIADGESATVEFKSSARWDYRGGKAEKFIEDGDNTYGGKYVTNPSGGLLSKGHPLGATGLAQCTELVWQLRGQAEKRQVEGAKIALQHNLGLGGACVMTMYRR